MRGRRPDGEHEISTLLQAVSLHDLLEVRVGDTTDLEVLGMELPCAGENLVVKAARALEAAAGRRLPASFRLWKRIPAGSGLGGGSSDAAAALRCLARVYGLNLDLRPIAASVGADVSFFLNGGRARASGRGEAVQQLEDEHGWFALMWPELAVSTADVYRRWDEVGGEPPNELQRAAALLHPELKAVVHRLGAGWQMSGSGSAFFKRCASRAEAQRCVHGLDGWTAVTHTVSAWA